MTLFQKEGKFAEGVMSEASRGLGNPMKAERG